MALTKPITTQTGIDLPNAYIRVTDVTLSYGNDRSWIILSTYKDKTARSEGKQPVDVEEFRLDNFNAVQQKDAIHALRIPVDHDPANVTLKVSLDFTGDGTNEVVITEGTEFTEGTDNATTLANIATALNGNTAFSAELSATAVTGSGDDRIEITPVSTGTLIGSNGNALVVSGLDHQLTQKGEDEVIGEFDSFFNIADLSLQDSNAIAQAYKYIKTVPKYSDATSA